MTDTPSEPSMTPALSPEAWRVWPTWTSHETRLYVEASSNSESHHFELGIASDGPPDDYAQLGAKDRHALAALCLYQQPFGFTQEDVKRHEHAADHWQKTLDAQGSEPTWDFGAEEMESRRQVVAWHRSMASRISALLPSQT